MKNETTPDPADAFIELIPAGQAAALESRFNAIVRGLTRLLGFAGVLAGTGVAGVILVRLIVVFFFHHQFADDAHDIARIAGLDRRLSKWLGGIVSWTAALGIAGIFFHFLLAVLWPFGRKGLRLWKPALILLAISGAGAVVPVAIKSVRGVDDAGLPIRMTEIDPASALWFDPDGTALIFYADHLDGQRRFWDRPGHTPRDRAEAKPVSSETHSEWLGERARLDRETAAREIRQREQARLESVRRELAEARATLKAAVAKVDAHRAIITETQIRAERARSEAEASEKAAAKARADAEAAVAAGNAAVVTRPTPTGTLFRPPPAETGGSVPILHISPKPAASPALLRAAPVPIPSSAFSSSPAVSPSPGSGSGWRSPDSAPGVTAVNCYRLIPGRSVNINVYGDSVECWANGRTVMWADSNPKRVYVEAGYPIHFNRYQTIHVAPLDRCATELKLRKKPATSATERGALPASFSRAHPFAGVRLR